jgi:predicted O-methyltransferase YrrM
MARPTKVMNDQSATNVVRNLLRPGYAKVVARKLLRRADPLERTRTEAVAWAAEHRVTPAAWCAERDGELWAETKEFGAELRARAKRLREETGQRIGGGARAELLYFLTRHTKPAVVVETGVAAGFSSTAFLTAMQRNGHGRLYSSDFPYFRSENPEEYVGILVPDELRADWTLLLKGDAENLPAILELVDHIDLYHYDSDKSYAGRRYGMNVVAAKLSAESVIMMDDIVDNVFFRDYVAERNEPFMVFGTGEHCVGALNLR